MKSLGPTRRAIDARDRLHRSTRQRNRRFGDVVVGVFIDTRQQADCRLLHKAVVASERSGDRIDQGSEGLGIRADQGLQSMTNDQRILIKQKVLQ